jgi:hypothetical protein
MNTHSLKAYIDYAIEQSDNKHINCIKVASLNQLKSRDLSIRATIIVDIEVLKQFIDN